MSTAPDNHDAYDYTERIRDRLPRRLRELREARGLSMYALWLKCGVSRDTISHIEGGETNCNQTQMQGLINKVDELINALQK